ncbi:MAG: type IV pili methyl-accepting chemotaxis transducer N-terminal domain-containing protein, partial [Proteobacteria bacterium]|nr:type IV pili methyl-accepting chemotaxis transducer N-terminal domain-containing protein [Pseudomonadota bacterium]
MAVLPLRRKLAILAAGLAALLIAALWVAWSDYRDAHFGEGHVAAAGELRMLSQRLAKAALRGLRGDAEAFAQIQSSRLVMLTQRMARGAQQLLAADSVEPEVEFLLGKDVNEFRGTVGRLRAAARDDDTRAALAALGENFGAYRDALVAVLGTRARLAEAKAAASAIHADSERLLQVVDGVVAAYRAAPARGTYQAALAAIAL